MRSINLEWLDQLPEPVRIFIYRKIMQLVRDYVKDTRTPLDDWAARIIGSFLAEALDVEPPDELTANDAGPNGDSAA